MSYMSDCSLQNEPPLYTCFFREQLCGVYSLSSLSMILLTFLNNLLHLFFTLQVILIIQKCFLPRHKCQFTIIQFPRKLTSQILKALAEADCFLLNWNLNGVHHLYMHASFYNVAKQGWLRCKGISNYFSIWLLQLTLQWNIKLGACCGNTLSQPLTLNDPSIPSDT